MVFAREANSRVDLVWTGSIGETVEMMAVLRGKSLFARFKGYVFYKLRGTRQS
jgi:hypothetical protein